ncbi:uncharacterized protein MONBRDRAFT_22386 [Monosiga brevicollis MX1]|uniref:Sister chromatid cohesion protein DCC1 n=1 Tax=Monosiga brevicollis TaxID=81824 RepID=A9UQF3_MONBE|nr:uncharacterized protein MONBRDRAFT_22386 [Monosiga brevicollis MX1]EDQ92588.1 predicted protein [Monosiga brevicollis MX1]|eukprot:XP_001742350.1 hypothetical protein [Monosiga brevicollis MX1]
MAEAPAAAPSRLVTPLVFGETFGANDISLWQLDDHLAQQIDAGAPLEIKAGTENAGAVLCSTDATYTIKIADVTDAHYFVQPEEGTKDPLVFSDEPRHIRGNVSSYFELHRTAPSSEQLMRLLRPQPYTGPTADLASIGISSAALRQSLLASATEIDQLLRLHDVVEHDGRAFLLEPSYAREVLDHILTTAAAEDLELTQLPLNVVAGKLVEFDVPHFAVRGVLHAHGEDLGDGLFKVDPIKVCRTRAIEIFVATDNPDWQLSSFLNTWQNLAGDECPVDVSMLGGLALVSERAVTTGDEDNRIITYFPESELPQQVKARFQALFRQQPIWTDAEIRPYLTPLSTKYQTVEQMLLQHARLFTRKGVKLYNAK